MAYENIQRFAKQHKSSDGTGGGGTTIYVNSGAKNGIMNVTNLNAANIDANRIHANNIEATNVKFKYIMSEYGDISKLDGVDLTFTNGHIQSLSSSEIGTDTLTVKDKATIENLVSTNINSNSIVTDYLTVNKSAHFFELVIDKIRSVQGTQMNTAANCVADYVHACSSTGEIVEPTASDVNYYRVYWKNTDDEGRAVNNDWLPLDQALCESFNVQTGTSYDTSNKYYWRKVLRTDGGTPKYVNFNTGAVQNSPQADYDIIFPNRFEFGEVGETPIFTDFTVESQITNEWDDANDTWTCHTTKYGLQLIVPDNYLLMNAALQFTTNIETKLNVGVYYTDSTFDYFPNNGYSDTYVIHTASGKAVEAFVILSEVVDTFEACNWIDLSNVDMDVTVSGKSAIPSIGDNICQLGYRYNELPNPTTDDIHRASAIIIAAYNTPDASIAPPSYAQYQNITDYNLSSHRKSYFDATGCYIVGNFAVESAGSVLPLDQYIQSQTSPQELEILIEDTRTFVDMCVMQVDANNQIHDMNNFPGMIDTLGRRHLYISLSSQQSYTPIYVNCDMFGRTVVLMDIDPNTGNTRLLPTADTSTGIYVDSVVFASDKLDVAFNFRGTDQTISNNPIIFYGQATIGGINYSANKSITVATVTSIQGTDAELYRLYKDTELAYVKQNKALDVKLRYGIQHIIGTSTSIDRPTGQQQLRIRRYNLAGDILDTSTLLSGDYITTGGKTGMGYWEYTYQLANWYTAQNKTVYLTAELMADPSTNLDSTLVDIMLDSNSLFSVQEGLTQSIQANTTLINNETQARQNQYTSISQTVNNINSTVANHTTSINQMNTDISEIDQKADRIGLHVDNVETDLDTLETNIGRTGIDIEQGKITLTAENTIIDGNLSIHNANEGLVIYDHTTDTPKIAVQGNQIGTWYDFQSSGSIVSDQYETRNTISGNRVTFQTIDIGNLQTDNKLSVGATITDVTSSSVTAINYTYNLLRNGSVESTSTGAATRTGNWFDFSIPELTITNSGSYSIQVIITVTGASAGDEFMLLLGVVRTLSVLQKIGTDGAFFGTSLQRISWFGSDRQRLQYDNSYIQLDTSGVTYKPTGSMLATEIGSTTTVMRRTSGTSYQAGLADGLIVIAPGTSQYGSWFTVYLPYPSMMAGKIYYVKNYSSNNVRVGVGSGSDEKYMMDDDSASLENFRDIGKRAYYFISDGVYWLIFYAT